MISESERPVAESMPLGRRRVLSVTAALAVLVALTLWRFPATSNETVHEFGGATMGTSFSVLVEADLSAGERQTVRETIEQRLLDVNRVMSTFDSGSELSRFNRHVGTDPVAATPELLEVLAMAREVSERSDGAFDVTVAPLVDAWGFGPSDPSTPTPDTVRLAALRSFVGYQQVLLDPAGGAISKMRPETTVDLSSIAKGYAVDAVASDLSALGFTSFLVEVGGELKARGTRREGRAWRVAIERPDATVSGVWGTVALTDEAIATSGDYRNYFEEDGIRYAHILDPRTGQPIRMVGASVSVVHGSAAMADAWATALSVLGPEEGYALARRESLAAVFVMQTDGGFESLTTPGLADRLTIEEEDR